jgi:hypothetical protein
MDVRDVSYGNWALLAADVSPSRYLFCPCDAAKMVSWQIVMADNSVRDVLFSEISQKNPMESVGSRVFFNAKSVPISGFQDLGIEALEFKMAESNNHGITFVGENRENLPCSATVSYKLSELYFRAEIALCNDGTLPIYWRPAVHFFINLPWIGDTPIEKHVVKSLAKKRMRMADDFTLINSAKSSEKTSLELLNDGGIGFTQLQDSRIWLGTSNEEEGLSFIFGNKTQRSAFVLRRTETDGKVEVAFLADMPVDGDMSISNGDLQNYSVVPQRKTEVFSVEISAY